MEQRHQSDLKARDEEIARLRSEVDRLRAGQPGPTASPNAPVATTPSTGPAAADSVDQATRDLIGEIDNASRPPGAGAVDQARRDIAADAAARSTPLTLRNPVSFNPDFAVVSDFLGSVSTHRSNDAYNRLDVREVELDLRAAVDPRADGVAILSIARDVDNPVFPTGAGVTGPDTTISIEEAYINLHDFGIPNLTAQLGRFHLRFGRENILHLHDLPTSDAPLVNQAFLAPEALADAGLSLSYVIPPNLIGGQYVEVIEQVLAGEGASSGSRTLTGDIMVDSPAFNTHVLWNTDLARDWNFELGGSWLSGKRGPRNDLYANLFGTDLTLIHTDPTGRFFNQLFQAEVDYAVIDEAAAPTQHAWGAYALAQQQIDRDWYAGVRLDWTEDPNHDNRQAYAASPYISWYWSEFLRFRAEYQYKAGDIPVENNLFFQVTWIFGAHPPHPYWAMR